MPSLKAKLSLGEDYLNSDIFDGFNYIGSSVSTDDQMLPPNLRGYAPDVSGVAHSSAKVTISQMGRVLYEPQFPPGHSAFRISATLSPAHCTSALKNRMVRCRNMTLRPHLCHSSRARGRCVTK
ncbi:fimbria/pilus outer membrane usher protein [Escherichia coli]|nr:hypothetical protein [Escherichia coli]EKN1672898.1 fimbria/pilus outer membrane usher protein [Escherichia coli]